MWWSILYSIIYFCILLKLALTFTKVHCKSNKCLIGKTAIITGGNSGMGYQTALNLASRGCKIIIGDYVDATNSVKTIIEKTGNLNVAYLHLDLSSFASVREFAKNVRSQVQRLDILINNAGYLGLNLITDDGVYRMLQVNYLGHFLLTHLLAPLLKQTKNSRVVFVSSLLAFLNDLKYGTTINRIPDIRYFVFENMYSYGNSKAYILAATAVFANNLKHHGVLVTAAHPGLVATGIFTPGDIRMNECSTQANIYHKIVLVLVKLFAKTPLEGIQSILHCALASKIHSSDFIVDGHNFPKPGILTDQFCKEIWEESVRLAHISEDELL